MFESRRPDQFFNLSDAWPAPGAGEVAEDAARRITHSSTMERNHTALRVARWRVSGQVQGVGFRWFVLRAAVSFRVRGDVRNHPDGSVEIRAAADPAGLERLLKTVRVGPPGARVDGIDELEPMDDLPHEGFHIRH